jgi:two-component system LytT family response regulator
MSHTVRNGGADGRETVTWESITADTGFAPPPATAPRVLVGEREHRFYVLRPQEIEYIESQGNYVKLHCGGAEYISRDTVKRLRATLMGSGFIRIKRSLLINIASIRYAERAGRGTYAFTLLSGSCLHSAPTYRDEILRALPIAARSSPRS